MGTYKQWLSATGLEAPITTYRVRRVRIREMTTLPSSCNFIPASEPEAELPNGRRTTLPLYFTPMILVENSGNQYLPRERRCRHVRTSVEETPRLAVAHYRRHKDEISRTSKNSTRLPYIFGSLRFAPKQRVGENALRQLKSRKTRSHICCEKPLVLRAFFFCLNFASLLE